MVGRGRGGGGWGGGQGGTERKKSWYIAEVMPQLMPQRLTNDNEFYMFHFFQPPASPSQLLATSTSASGSSKPLAYTVSNLQERLLPPTAHQDPGPSTPPASVSTPSSVTASLTAALKAGSSSQIQHLLTTIQAAKKHPPQQTQVNKTSSSMNS